MSDKSEQLDVRRLREEIDRVDQEILTLLNRRGDLAVEIGRCKDHRIDNGRSQHVCNGNEGGNSLVHQAANNRHHATLTGGQDKARADPKNKPPCQAPGNVSQQALRRDKHLDRGRKERTNDQKGHRLNEDRCDYG